LGQGLHEVIKNMGKDNWKKWQGCNLTCKWSAWLLILLVATCTRTSPYYSTNLPTDLNNFIIISMRSTDGENIWGQTPKSPIARCSYRHETPFGCQNEQSEFGDFGVCKLWLGQLLSYCHAIYMLLSSLPVPRQLDNSANHVKRG
jgi:hypothetical protein